MMNRTAAVFFLFSRRPGEYLPLFWLAGAFVLGFLWSLAYASGLVAEEPLPWPAGRLMFAFYGMLVYGWALPVLFSFAAGSRSRWMKPAEWLWHACVALGLATIAAGNGSGVLLMPFDWWVCPVFAFLAAGAACVAWFRPFPWPVRLLFSSSAGCVAAALWALGYTQALSMNGLLDVSALGGSLSCGLMFAALGAAALRLDMAQGRAAGILSVWMALVLAAVCGAVPVITTATDLHGLFAVDEWAKRQGCIVAEPERIKRVSGALLAGKRVHFTADWPIQGTPPAGVQPAAGGCADFALTLTPTGQALHIVPRIAVLGIGCRRGKTAEHLEAAFADFCRESGLTPQGVAAAASIDLKRDEPGLAAFCRDHGWDMDFYTAAQLRAVPGSFTASGFVTSVTGVDNVCERAAVLASGGKLLLPKWARDGVTFAAALRPFAPDWRWRDDEP